MTLLDKLKSFLGTLSAEDLENLAVKDSNADDNVVNKTSNEVLDASTSTGGTDETDDNQSDAQVADSTVNSDSATSTVSADDNTSTTAVDTVIFEDGWFDADALSVDSTKINNAVVAEAIQKVIDGANNRVIREATEYILGAELEGSNLAVSRDVVKGLIDTSTIGANGVEGISQGVRDAVSALKEKEPALFKPAESSPLKEAFNPVGKVNTNVTPNSFGEAFRIMEEIN